jgi:hypothetical protein
MNDVEDKLIIKTMEVLQIKSYDLKNSQSVQCFDFSTTAQTRQLSMG